MNEEPISVAVSMLESSIQAIHHFFRFQEFHIQSQHGISALEMDILQLVCRNGPTKMKEVAAHYQLKLSTLTSAVDKAQQHAVLTRVPSLVDKRVIMIEATPKGHEIYQGFVSHMNELLGNLITQMSHQEYQQLSKGLEAFLKVYPMWSERLAERAQ